MALVQVPGRGRIIVVDFEKSGTWVRPEMNGRRPCLVIHNNKLYRGDLVTVVPLSMTEPKTVCAYHHQMSAESFENWPSGQDGPPRWAKCDYVTTVALERCNNPYMRDRVIGRAFLNVRATKEDIAAVERCVLWALGIVVA